jgi:hypothetical protein
MFVTDVINIENAYIFYALGIMQESCMYLINIYVIEWWCT